MNENPEVETAAAFMVNNVLPKPGTLTVGSDGLEYRSDEGNARERLAWDELVVARVDIFRSRVRSLELHDADGRVTTFAVDDGVAVLRGIAAHAGREKIVSVNEEARRAAQGPHDLIGRLRALLGRPDVEKVELEESDE